MKSIYESTFVFQYSIAGKNQARAIELNRFIHIVIFDLENSRI